jgi:hypothetical protein
LTIPIENPSADGSGWRHADDQAFESLARDNLYGCAGARENALAVLLRNVPIGRKFQSILSRINTRKHEAAANVRGCNGERFRGLTRHK